MKIIKWSDIRAQIESEPGAKEEIAQERAIAEAEIEDYKKSLCQECDQFHYYG